MNAIRFLLLSFVAAFGCNYIAMPTDFTTVSSGTRANLHANFSEVENKFNPCADSVAQVRARLSGYTTNLTVSSLENLRLRVDSDASTTALFLVEGGAGDSLFRVSENLNARLFGHVAIDSNLTVRKVTAVDSLLGPSLTLSGLTASRLVATNAGKTAASVSDLTSWIAGTANQITSTSDGDGSLTLSLPSAVTFPGTVTSTGLFTASAGVSATGGSLLLERTASGSTITTGVENNSTSASSGARLHAQVNGASAGDPFVHFSISGVQEWATGPDNSDGDAYVITPGATPGATTNGLRISPSGAVSAPGTLDVTGVTTATGGLSLGARFIDKTTTVTNGTTSVTTAHSTIFADGTSGTVTLNLPAASGNAGLTYTVFDIDATTNAITLDGNASETIGGATTVSLIGNVGMGVIVIVCDGSNWRIKELYDEGTFTGTFTGMSGATTATIEWALRGKMVTLNIPQTSGTSNTTAMTITGVPSGLRPAQQIAGISVAVQDNGAPYDGWVYIETSGTLSIYRKTVSASVIIAGSFTASGAKGVPGITIPYSLL